MRKSFYGTGWGFPVTFSKPNQGEGGVCTVRMVTVRDQNIEDIAESLTILFTTRPGERVMRPDFGASLEDLMFEPSNISLLTYIREMIKRAVLFYEPRIILDKVDISSELLIEGTITVEIEFSVRSTNNRFNYVFDYYKREATISPI